MSNVFNFPGEGKQQQQRLEDRVSALEELVQSLAESCIANAKAINMLSEALVAVYADDGLNVKRKRKLKLRFKPKFSGQVLFTILMIILTGLITYMSRGSSFTNPFPIISINKEISK